MYFFNTWLAFFRQTFLRFLVFILAMLITGDLTKKSMPLGVTEMRKGI